MTTSLVTYGTSTAATTLTTANTLVTSSGGTLTTKDTKYATLLNFIELYSQGNATASSSGSIGSPTGHGWLLDATTLEGQQIVAGNWTPKVRLGASTSIGADIYVRAYVRSSDGTYTLIGTIVKTAQTIFSTTNFTLPATSLPAQNFNTGDKLYIDAWLNITSNASGTSTSVVHVSMSASSSLGGTNAAQTTTPGYQAQSSGGLGGGSASIQSIASTVLTSMHNNAWNVNATTKQHNGSEPVTGGLFVNWEQAITWASADPLFDTNNPVSIDSTYLSQGCNATCVHDPQTCLLHMQALSEYLAIYPGDHSYDSANASGYMGLSALVDHLTLNDFKPQTSATNYGGYSEPKGWIYFALLNVYTNLQNNSLLSASQVAALKQSLLYAAWVQYNTWTTTWVDGSSQTQSIICNNSHTPAPYVPGQVMLSCAALYDAAVRFPNDIVTGMFYKAGNPAQSPALWQASAQLSFTNLLNRGAYNSSAHMFYDNMTLNTASATDTITDTGSKGTTAAEAAEALTRMYLLTGTAAYKTQVQTVISTYYSTVWDATGGGFYFAYDMGGAGLNTAHKETRSTSEFLRTLHYYNLNVALDYVTQETNMVTALTTFNPSGFYQPSTAGSPGYMYRFNGDFSIVVDSYSDSYTGATLQAAANIGDTSVQVSSKTGLPTTGNIALVIDGIDAAHGNASDEEPVFSMPAVGSVAPFTLNINTKYNGTGKLAKAHSNGASITSILNKQPETQITSEACGVTLAALLFTLLPPLQAAPGTPTPGFDGISSNVQYDGIALSSQHDGIRWGYR